MTENEKYLKEAQAKIKAFETEKEPERLRESAMALENIILAKEHETEVRKKLRSDSLTSWLTLLQIFDKHYQPDFNPDDMPEMLVQPPPQADGSVLRPGADPAKIADPKARAEYEKAIAENRAKQENYRMQIQLGRLDDFIPPSAENFITNSFSDADEDQKELREAIDKTIENENRKTRLMTLVKAEKTTNQ